MIGKIYMIIYQTMKLSDLGVFYCDEQGNHLWHDAYEYAILSNEWFERSK